MQHFTMRYCTVPLYVFEGRVSFKVSVDTRSYSTTRTFILRINNHTAKHLCCGTIFLHLFQTYTVVTEKGVNTKLLLFFTTDSATMVLTYSVLFLSLR